MSIIGHQLAKDSCPWTGAQHTEGMAVGVPMQVPPSAEGGYRTGRETCQLPRDGVKQMRDRGWDVGSRHSGRPSSVTPTRSSVLGMLRPPSHPFRG